MTFAERTSSHHAPPEVHAAVEAIKRRLAWPSIHWGVEDVHPDAWPHIAAAALDSVGVTPEEAWDKGYTSGHSNAMRRMSDEPDAPTSPNPYRLAPRGTR